MTEQISNILPNIDHFMAELRSRLNYSVVNKVCTTVISLAYLRRVEVYTTIRESE